MSLFSFLSISLIHSFFNEASKHSFPANATDLLPSREWLEKATISSSLYSLWNHCSLTIKETEFSKKKKKYEPLDEPRYFLTVPQLDKTMKKKEESNSFYNHLFILLHNNQISFFRCIWHSFTNSNMIELVPINSTITAKADQLIILDCGSVDF